MQREKNLKDTSMTLPEIAEALSGEALLRFKSQHGRLPKTMEAVFFYLEEKRPKPTYPLFEQEGG